MTGTRTGLSPGPETFSGKKASLGISRGGSEETVKKAAVEEGEVEKMAEEATEEVVVEKPAPVSRAAHP